MDKGRDKHPKGPGDPRDPRDAKTSEAKKAGQPTAPGGVAVDHRGRNIWQFHGEAIDSTSMMLQRLDNPALALEPTRKTKRLDSIDSSTPADSPSGKGPATGGAKRRAEPGAARGQPVATRAQPGPARSPAASRRQEDDDSEQSFEQSFSVKPGKNSGGGFDPYNNS